MIGVKQLALAERVERVGRLPEADSEAPDRNAQDAHRMRSMRSTKTEAESGGNCASLLRNG